MSRLTKCGAISQRDIDELLEYSDENQFGRNDAYFKLQRYEDLGFTPEEIAYMAKFYKEQTSVAAITANLKIAEALAELDKYKKAEKQGLLLKLPFTLGQTIYWIAIKCDANLEEDGACDKYECEECPYDKEFTIVEGAAQKYHIVSFLEGTLERQYFLSKEEAEKALEEMEK